MHLVLAADNIFHTLGLTVKLTGCPDPLVYLHTWCIALQLPSNILPLVIDMGQTFIHGDWYINLTIIDPLMALLFQAFSATQSAHT